MGAEFPVVANRMVHRTGTTTATTHIAGSTGDTVVARRCIGNILTSIHRVTEVIGAGIFVVAGDPKPRRTGAVKVTNVWIGTHVVVVAFGAKLAGRVNDASGGVGIGSTR